jgi:hypothetical protein
MISWNNLPSVSVYIRLWEVAPNKDLKISWAEKDAYASQCIYHKGKFYWYVAVGHKSNEDSKGGLGIGVAVSDRPCGPFKDAIGKALVVNEMTTDMKYAWDDIDPTSVNPVK